MYPFVSYECEPLKWFFWLYNVQLYIEHCYHDKCSANGTIVDGIKQIVHEYVLEAPAIDYEQTAINSAFCQLFSHYKAKEH